MQDVLNQLIKKLDGITRRMEMLHLDAYLRYLSNWKKRLMMEFLSGIARGMGFSIGFSVLGALVLYLLRNMAMANLPVIGRFLADLFRIVEKNL